jgi:hypothetical protein
VSRHSTAKHVDGEDDAGMHESAVPAARQRQSSRAAPAPAIHEEVESDDDARDDTKVGHSKL